MGAMQILGYDPTGFDGELVSVEVDIRRGIPGVDLVGLADEAVREARERVRVAVRNSGFVFPPDRILVNLAPAAVRKIGSGFDLPIAVAILAASGAVPVRDGTRVLVVGELELSGRVRPVRGALSAAAAALEGDASCTIVPAENLAEASALGSAVYGVGSLAECARLLALLAEGRAPARHPGGGERTGAGPTDHVRVPAPAGDFAELRGQPVLRRALEIAAAGMHNVFLFGPPGSGKTMAVRRFSGLLPDLGRSDAITVTRLHSLAGLIEPNGGLIVRPPFRMPHHSASLEGIIGGGRNIRPGEISLAHRGVLFLDETAEFRKDVLQALREPIEEGRVTIARAGRSVWLPADFQLVLAANPCPCGNLGRSGGICVCSAEEILRYRRRIGAPLLDRIDIRVPVAPASAGELAAPPGESTAAMAARVLKAVRLQELRYAGLGFSRNARLPAGLVDRYCALDGDTVRIFTRAVERLSLSSRACHSILKIARTIADLEGTPSITRDQLLEAIQHRRYGDDNLFWDAA